MRLDGGKLDVAGHIDASGTDAGSIHLYAKNDVTVLAGAKLDAVSTGSGESGGTVEIGTAQGALNLAQGSAIDVQGGAQWRRRESSAARTAHWERRGH